MVRAAGSGTPPAEREREVERREEKDSVVRANKRSDYAMNERHPYQGRRSFAFRALCIDKCSGRRTPLPTPATPSPARRVIGRLLVEFSAL